ncbi:rIIA protein [Erwinia phage COW86c]
MKLIADNEEVLGSAGKKTKFTIQASPKAFMILSDKLYKNKIRAVVRELTTNWLDAHILNGKQDVPCEIKCPNKLDPRFIIRDFGPGMSDFQIRGNDEEPGLYNSYFASTKAESNDFIGALGLGSKSPFSYTKSFTIVSYYEGEARGYMAVMNNGEPDIRPLFVEPMKEGEQTGIEITVPVRLEDVEKFAHEIAYVMRPMPVKPIITGANIQIDSFPQDVEWFHSPNGFGKDARGLYAVYGKIVYPIDRFEGLECSWLLNRYGCVYVNFPLGELDITPSREELSLDDVTIENIKKRVNSLEKATLEADIAHLQSIENKRELVRQLSQFDSSQISILNRQNVLFDGKTHAQWSAVYNINDIQKKIEDSMVYTYLVNLDAERMRLTSSWSTRKRTSVSNLLNVQQNKVHIMIDDKPSRRAAMFRGMYLKEFYRHERFIMIDPTDPKHLEIKDDIVKLFDKDEVVILKSSEMDEYRKFEKEHYSNTGKGDSGPRPKSPNGQLHKFDSNGWWSSEDLFMNKDDIAELEGYAIFRSRDEIRTFPDELYWSNVDIETIRNLAKEFGITEFYVIRPNSAKAAKLNDNLESLDRFIVDEFIKIIDDMDPDEYLPTSFFNRRVVSNIINTPKLKWLLKFITGKDNGNKVSRINEIGRNLQHSYIVASSDGTSQIREDLALCNRIYNKLTAAATAEADAAFKKFEKEYPVIEHMLNEWRVANYADDISRIMRALEGAPSLKGESEDE